MSKINQRQDDFLKSYYDLKPNIIYNSPYNIFHERWVSESYKCQVLEMPQSTFSQTSLIFMSKSNLMTGKKSGYIHYVCEYS